MKKDRIYYMDIARSFAVLWIVGYWHLREYLPQKVSFYGDASITDIVLGLFMFLSGFFLARYRFANFYKDVFLFYKKRFVRIYILYAISAVTLYLIGFNPDFHTLLTTLTATATYIPPSPNTLWFVTMLLSFYAFTPFVHCEGTAKSLLRMFLVFVLFVCLFVYEGIDFRFFWCFPLYCLGLHMGKKPQFMNVLLKNKITAISTCVLICLFLFFYYYPVSYKIQYVILPFGIHLTLYLSRILANSHFNIIVEKVAYSSMCAYLFHRQLYYLLWDHCHFSEINLPVLLYCLFSIIVCFIVSYAIQYWYDRQILPLMKF